MDNTTPNIPQNHTSEQKSIHLTPFHLIIIFSLLIFTVLVFISFNTFFHKNPYGNQIKINNIDKVYSNIPNDTKDAISNTLYNTVSNNTMSDLKKVKATIRDNTAKENYDKTTNIYTDTFIVDLADIEQSYDVTVTWSPTKDNPYLVTGYPILITCPKADQLIYPAFDCSDGFADSDVYNDPVFTVLPIEMSYYNDDYSVYTSYSIETRIEDKKQVIIVINDNTGGNYEAALKKLRESNINPDNYKIEYNNLSSEQTPARAPNN